MDDESCMTPFFTVTRITLALLMFSLVSITAEQAKSDKQGPSLNLVCIERTLILARNLFCIHLVIAQAVLDDGCIYYLFVWFKLCQPFLLKFSRTLPRAKQEQ